MAFFIAFIFFLSSLFENFKLGIFLSPKIQLAGISDSDYCSAIKPNLDVRLQFLGLFLFRHFGLFDGTTV